MFTACNSIKYNSILMFCSNNFQGLLTFHKQSTSATLCGSLDIFSINFTPSSVKFAEFIYLEKTNYTVFKDKIQG